MLKKNLPASEQDKNEVHLHSDFSLSNNYIVKYKNLSLCP